MAGNLASSVVVPVRLKNEVFKLNWKKKKQGITAHSMALVNKVGKIFITAL